MTDPIKLDLACGRNCAGGFQGVDIGKIPGVQQVNLLEFPWPFETGSVDEVRCAHFIEHIPMVFWTPRSEVICGGDPQRWKTEPRDMTAVQVNEYSVDLLLKFFDEIHRILKPGGKATIICPGAHNDRAFQDPTHRRFIVPGTFLYLCRRWRRNNALEHAAYDIECDFPMPEDGKDAPEGIRYTTVSYTMSDEERKKSAILQERARKEKFKYYRNAAEDLYVELHKPAVPRVFTSEAEAPAATVAATA